MNEPNDLWGNHALPLRVRWRLLAWVVQHRPGDALDKALGRLGPRLQFDISDRAALSAELARRSALEVDSADFLAALGLTILGQTFALAPEEQLVLATVLQLELDSEFSDWLAMLNETIGGGWHTQQRLLAFLIGVSPRQLHTLLSTRSTLRKTELISLDLRGRQDFEDRVCVRHDVVEFCADPSHDLPRLCAGYFTTCGKGQLQLSDYPEMADSIARMRGVLSAGGAGTHLLLYGPPGTGKTQLAHALASALDLTLYAVPCQDSDREPIEHQARLAAFAQAQLLLAGRDDALLLFDEVEDVMRSAGPSRDGKHRAVSFKGWLHEQLEHAPRPTIWVSNSLACFDAAQLRRFACIAEVAIPGLRQRRVLVAGATQALGLDAAVLEGISRRTDLAPAELHAVSREAQRCPNPATTFRDALDARLRASGRPRLRAQTPSRYDLMHVNTTPALAPMLHELQRAPSARVLLSGPPGSGKTALALHLAETLERPLLLKRASDLVSPWVGETEQNLAQAFDEATRDGALFLLDEVDSFLAARHAGQRSWELSQVNELLKQLEDFDGLFFAATNLPDLLDPAALRRFDFKLHFGWLDLPARCSLVETFLIDQQIKQVLSAAARAQALADLPYLLPGDLAALRRRVSAYRDQLDDRELLAWLRAEHALKPEANKRTIGFAAA